MRKYAAQFGTCGTGWVLFGVGLSDYHINDTAWEIYLDCVGVHDLNSTILM